jgi:HEAT repeat protein
MKSLVSLTAIYLLTAGNGYGFPHLGCSEDDKRDNLVGALIRSLKDEDSRVRAASAKRLEQLGPAASRAVPALIDALGDKDEEVRVWAAFALSEIGSDAVPPLIKLLGHKESLMRARAMSALRLMGGLAKPAIPVLLRIAENDDDVAVRCDAVDLLCHTGDESVISPVCRLLESDKERLIRVCAAEAVGQFGAKAKAAIPSLIDVMKKEWKDKEYPSLPSTAAETLAWIGADAALPLVNVMGDADCPLLVRENASGALWRMAGVIGADAPKGAIPTLRSLLLTDKDKVIRVRAADILGRMGFAAKEAATSLRSALADEDELVRVRSALALYQVIGRNPNTVPTIVVGLKSNDPDIRRRSADALAELRSEAKAAVSVLIESLTDKKASVRESSVKALRNIGPDARDAVSALKRLEKEDSEPSVRKFAVEALDRIEGRPK